MSSPTRAATGLQRQGLMIFIIQIYLKTGETLQSNTNSLIFSQLMAFLQHLGAPFIIGGDWQNEPEALATTVIQNKFKASILDTGDPTTLHGSHIDFLLVSNALIGSVKLEACWEVPWRPHCALQLLLDCDQPAQPVLQLQRFPPI